MSYQWQSADQIERLHLLAALPKEDIETQYSEELMSWLVKFVDEELPGLGVPPVGSPNEFASAVIELGRNKRAWSNSLASLVIALSDSQTGDEKHQALARLNDFADQCPWKFLSDSARNRSIKS